MFEVILSSDRLLRRVENSVEKFLRLIHGAHTDQIGDVVERVELEHSRIAGRSKGVIEAVDFGG